MNIEKILTLTPREQFSALHNIGYNNLIIKQLDTLLDKVCEGMKISGTK